MGWGWAETPGQGLWRPQPLGVGVTGSHSVSVPWAPLHLSSVSRKLCVFPHPLPLEPLLRDGLRSLENLSPAFQVPVCDDGNDSGDQSSVLSPWTSSSHSTD